MSNNFRMPSKKKHDKWFRRELCKRLSGWHVSHLHFSRSCPPNQSGAPGITLVTRQKWAFHQKCNRGSANPITGDVKDIVLRFVVGFLIELDDGKICRKAPYLMGKSMVSCRFSLKPIQSDFRAFCNPLARKKRIHVSSARQKKALGKCPKTCGVYVKCPG